MEKYLNKELKGLFSNNPYSCYLWNSSNSCLTYLPRVFKENHVRMPSGEFSYSETDLGNVLKRNKSIMTKLISLTSVGPTFRDYLCTSLEATLKFVLETTSTVTCYYANKWILEKACLHMALGILPELTDSRLAIAVLREVRINLDGVHSSLDKCINMKVDQ